MQTFTFLNANGKPIKDDTLKANIKDQAIQLANAYAEKNSVTVTVIMSTEIHVTAPKGNAIEF